MKITKKKLKKIMQEEMAALREDEYFYEQLDPEDDMEQLDEEDGMDPLAGGMTGGDAEWSVDPHPAEPADTGPLEVYSMGAPRQHGGPPIAAFHEGRVNKDLIEHMIAEELDLLQEKVWVPGRKKSGKWIPGHYASGPGGGGLTITPRRGASPVPRGRKGYNIRRRVRPNWGAIGAGIGGLALGGMAGYMAGGGGQGTGGRHRRRPHPYRRDQGARPYGGQEYRGTYGPPGGHQPIRYPAREPMPARGFGGSQSMADAQDLYDAMKGGGTDEQLIWDVLNANLHPRKMMSLWDGFGRVLQSEDDVEEGNLIDWLEDDGMTGAAKAVRMLMNGQAVPWNLANRLQKEDV